MDLYDFYEKYCLEKCPERRIYSSFFNGQIGICHHCHYVSFIEFVNESTTRYVNMSTLTEEEEQLVLSILSEIAEERDVRPEEAFKVLISFGVESYQQMKSLYPILNPKE